MSRASQTDLMKVTSKINITSKINKVTKSSNMNYIIYETSKKVKFVRQDQSDKFVNFDYRHK